MSSLRRSISSISALATFEAAARLGGFTRAAEELGVTQAAVSRQIRLLESDLGTPLFIRTHRRVVPTPAGEALAAAASGAFGRLAEVIETIRRPQAPETLTIGATLAFCHFWLMPRLPEFRAAHPGTRLRLLADDTVSDLRRDRLDVCVRYGQPPFDDGLSHADCPDEVVPVCSPSVLAAAGPAPDLLRLPLIASDWVEPSWLTWRRWAQLAGLGPEIGRVSDRSTLRLNHYADTVHAAIAGEGVALGWTTLLSDPLRDGRLLRIGAHSVQPRERYHVLTPTGREPTPAARTFLHWIAGRFRRGDP